MKVYTYFKKQCNPTAVALGCFDGVHLGHQQVISAAVEFKKESCSPTVFTFDKNPKCVLNNQTENKIINTEKKIQLMRQMGIKILYEMDFLKLFYLTPEEFIKNILKGTLNAGAAICGFNYRFGRNAQAGIHELETLCKKYGIKTIVIPPVLYKGEPISSTRIREAIKLNNTNDVNYMLGRNNY